MSFSFSFDLEEPLVWTSIILRSNLDFFDSFLDSVFAFTVGSLGTRAVVVEILPGVVLPVILTELGSTLVAASRFSKISIIMFDLGVTTTSSFFDLTAPVENNLETKNVYFLNGGCLAANSLNSSADLILLDLTTSTTFL